MSRLRQLFISYARDPKPEDAADWELDDYSAPMEAIEHYLNTCSASERCSDIIDLVVDKGRLKSGDDLKKFMKYAAKSDHVLIILSDRSVKSAYCVYEYHVMLQSIIDRKITFEEMVVPVNLNSRIYTDVSNLKECRDYWRNSEQVKIEPLFDVDEDDFREDASQALKNLAGRISKTVALRIEWQSAEASLPRIADRLGLPSPDSLVPSSGDLK